MAQPTAKELSLLVNKKMKNETCKILYINPIESLI
jgi:hypothetical protein